MWNQNSEEKKDDISVAETVVTTQAQHLHQHLPTSNISGGNGKTIRNNLESGGGERNNFGHSTTSKDKDNYLQDDEAIDSGFLSAELTQDSGLLSAELAQDLRKDNFDSTSASAGDTNTQKNTRGSGGGSGSKSIAPVQLNIVHSKDEGHSASTDLDLDSGYIDSSSHCHPPEDSPMILDKAIDAGLPEWFCKLTLTNSIQPVNNLGAASQRTEPWEEHYQQNDQGDTHLHMACITGHVEVVAALIRMAPHPCMFNIQNDEAQTSLHLAVIYGMPKILRMLLIAGAEPSARDRHGNTPLHLACISGDLRCVQALILPIGASEINEAHRFYGHLSNDKTTSYLDCASLPADLELRNYDGERCVHLAAQGGHVEILKHLVYFGADINAREGKSGRTPLHYAIESCNEVLANFLLVEYSATLKIETATYAGLTAYQMACILKNPSMQNYLENKGAQTLTPPDSDYDYDSSDIETDLDDSQMFNRFGGPHYFANYNGGGNPINVA